MIHQSLTPSCRRRLRVSSSSESGFTLAAVLVMVTILAMVLAYTVPRMWSDVLKRERDKETIWVMKQYARAIVEFQRRRGALPVSLDQLAEQEKPRVLRRLYPNPLSGEMDWIMVPPGAPPGAGGTRTDLPRGIGAPATEQPRPSTPSGPSPSPTDYRGPFIGVRPPNSGTSYIALNGAERYEEWLWTINEHQQQFNPTPTPSPPTRNP